MAAIAARFAERYGPGSGTAQVHLGARRSRGGAHARPPAARRRRPRVAMSQSNTGPSGGIGLHPGYHTLRRGARSPAPAARGMAHRRPGYYTTGTEGGS